MTMESFEAPDPQFKVPDLEQEYGEFVRVAQTFDLPLEHLLPWAEAGSLVELDDQTWDALGNTDSNRFSAGDWAAVATYSDAVQRDWHDLREKMLHDTPLDAPIVMQMGNDYHLLAGNTRLMVARAASITPLVWLFPVKTN